MFVDFPFPISHPLPRPGGMRIAIESAALVVDKSWRVKPKPKPKATSSDPKLQISLNPPLISPQRPRTFRPAASNRPWTWILRFSFRSALAEPNAKKLFWLDCDANLPQKCKLQDASFMVFML